MKKIFSSRLFSFGLGHSIFLGSRLLRDLILARVLGSQMFGAWAAVNILRQYGNYSDLGMMNGLARELPQINQDQKQMSELAGQAVLGTVFGTLAIILIVIFFQPTGFSTQGIGWVPILLMATFICFEKVYKFFNAILLGTDQVKTAGHWLSALSLLDLLLAILGAYFWGLQGLLLGTVIAVVLTTALMSLQSRIKINYKFSAKSFKLLFLSSILLMCFGLINVALHNIDRTVFLFLNGPDEILGSYHAAALLTLTVSILPFIVCSVINPRVYALRPDQNAEFLNIVSTSGFYSCVLACAGGVIAVLISSQIFRLFFPLQVHAVQIAPYLILGEMFYASSMILDSILLVKKIGLKILIFKAVVLVSFMSLAMIYLINKNDQSPLDLAIHLAQVIAFVQVACFIVSYSFCIFGFEKNTRYKIFITTITWPLMLAGSAAAILLFFR